MMNGGSWTRPTCSVFEVVPADPLDPSAGFEVVEHHGEVHWKPLSFAGIIPIFPGLAVVLDGMLEVIEDELEADYYEEECRAEGQPPVYRDLVLVPRTDPVSLTQAALALLPLVAPPTTTSPPPGGIQLVNLKTWLWIDPGYWQPHTRTAEVLGFATTVSAEPTRVEWDMGNGDTVVCHGPGTPYDAGRRAADQDTACGYTYRRAGAYTVTATVTWEGTGSIGGIPVEVGSVERYRQFRLDVTESQAIVVR